MSVTFSNADGPITVGFGPTGPGIHTSPYPSIINVTNALNQPVASLKVELTNFFPPVLPDLGLLLVSPNGSKMNLFAGAGRDDDQLAPVTVTLNDNANHTMNQFLVDGQSYKPTQNNFEYIDYPSPAPKTPYSNPGTEFDSTATLNDTFVRNLDPSILQGQWKLYIFNINKKGTSGSLGGWKLTFTYATQNLVFPQTFADVSQPTLPSGWISETTLDLKAPWTTISTMPYAPANKLGAPGISYLMTNFFTIEQGTLFDLFICFNLMYYTKESVDGAVLEFQIQGEQKWHDITTLFIFPSSPYNGVITDNTNPISPLGDREAWTGNSNGLIQTTIKIFSLFYQEQSRTIRFRWVLGLTGKAKSPGVFIDNLLITTLLPLQFMKFSFNNGLLPNQWSTSVEGNADPWTFIKPVSQPNLAYIPDISVSQLVQTKLVTPPVSFSTPHYIDFDLLWDLDDSKHGLILEIQQSTFSFNPVPKNQFVLNGYNGIITLIGTVDVWTGNSGNVYKHVRAILPSIPDGKVRLNLIYTPANLRAGMNPVEEGFFRRTLPRSIGGPGLGVLVDNLQIMQVNFDNMTPTVTDSVTNEGVQTTSGLVIIPPTNPDVQFYKITNINNGLLFKNDGITPILNGDFITVAQGLAGLKFTPNSLNTGSFKIQSSLIASDLGLGGDVIMAQIVVIPFVPPIPCLHPKTLVWTMQGYKRISDIRAGDMVMCGSGLTSVTFNMKFGSSNKFIKIEKGALGHNMPMNPLIIKPNHPLLLRDTEVMPEKLVKNVKGVKKLTLPRPIAVWSICTKNRCFINMEGIQVCTWSDSDPNLSKYQFEKY